VFSFQFVNSFASLFYIGFVKPYIPTIDACVNLSCMTELQTTLGTIFLMRVTIGNVTELGTLLVVAALRYSCAWCALQGAECCTSIAGRQLSSACNFLGSCRMITAVHPWV
jgi:hypothetical protein